MFSMGTLLQLVSEIFSESVRAVQPEKGARG